MTGTTLLWLALVGTFATMMISVLAAVFAGRYRKKVATFISDEIVVQKKILQNIDLTGDSMRELQRIISEKMIPIEISIKPLDKKKKSVTLKPLGEEAVAYSVPNETASAAAVLHQTLRRNLALADTATITSVLALMMVVVSFMAMLRPSSFWDLIAVAVAPVGLIVAAALGMIIGRIIKRRRLTRGQ